MPIFDINGASLSPCICSKAKFALGLKNTRPHGNTKRNLGYWQRVVNRVATLNNINDPQIIENAINMYDDLFVINP